MEKQKMEASSSAPTETQQPQGRQTACFYAEEEATKRVEVRKEPALAEDVSFF